MTQIDTRSLYKFITDYKNADGKDYHQCFAIVGEIDYSVSETERRIALGEWVKHMLTLKGYTPTRIILADCDLTLDELQDLTDGILPKGPGKVIGLEILYDTEESPLP